MTLRSVPCLALAIGAAIGFWMTPAAAGEPPEGSPGVDVPARQDLEKGTYEPNKEYYDNIWFELADEPEHHFLEALEAFQQERLDTAADQIRRGSTFLKVEATRAVDRGETGESRLGDAYRALRFLAEDVEQGRVEDASRLDRGFAHAHAELARHHLALARERWAPGEGTVPAVAVGRHLGGSVQHLRRALTWARADLRPGQAALDQAARVAETLEGDLEKPLLVEDVRGAFDAVEAELERLDAMAGPSAPES